VHTLVNQIESINFVKDWQAMRCQPGSKLYKKNFTEAVYKKCTNLSPPILSSSQKEDVQLFKVISKTDFKFRPQPQFVKGIANCHILE
jgi:hypothetical protein